MDIKLIFVEEYDKRFYELTKENTHKEAFEIVEREYYETFGKSRYSSYDSYRVTRDKRRR